MLFQGFISGILVIQLAFAQDSNFLRSSAASEPVSLDERVVDVRYDFLAEESSENSVRNSWPNFFDVPEKYAVADFHPSHPLYKARVDTEASTSQGYLYTWFNYKNTPLDGSKVVGNDSCGYYPNIAIGVALNTCLLSGKTNTSTSRNSILYTCDGVKGYKTVYQGTTCGAGVVLDTQIYPLDSCFSYRGVRMTMGCSPYSSTIALPSPQNGGASQTSSWVTTEMYAENSCAGSLIEYIAFMNGQCLPLLDVKSSGVTVYSAFYQYPNTTTYHKSHNCTGPHDPVSHATTTCITSVDDTTNTNPQKFYVPRTPSFVTALLTPQPFVEVTSPPTPPPTQPPQIDQSCTYDVVQQLFNIDETTYNANYDANNVVLSNTIASVMTGVSANNVVIKDIKAYNLETTGLTTQATYCYAMYTVTIPSSSSAGYANGNVAYSSTTKQLNSALASGTFNSQMTYYANKYSDSSMASVTSEVAKFSTAVVTTNDDDNDNGLSTGELAGVIVGSVVGFALIAGVVYYFVFVQGGAKGSASSSSTVNSTHANAASAPVQEVEATEVVKQASNPLHGEQPKV